MQTRRKSPWLALVILASIGTVGFIDRIVVNVLVEPVKAEFSLSDTQVSFMGLAFTALYIVVGLFIARLAERRRRLTLISIGTLIWSAATAICGLAGSWVQLLVARMGVGFGEAVGLPGNQSVVADYFPANKRATAMSVLLLAPPVGAFIGFVGGGWIAQEYDWRFTFLIAAIPGFFLAALAYIFIAEPPRGQHDKGASETVPPISAVVKRLFALSSARNFVIGSTLAATLGFGLNYFFTSLMIREFEVSLAEAGLYSGLIASAPAALSVMLSGILGDKLGSKNPAFYALIPGICLLIGGPIYVLGITREGLGLLLALVSVATFLNFGYLGITFASLQNLMHPRMRATASAILNTVYGIAGGLGPVALGWLSDTMAVTHGSARGLMLAMAIGGALYVVAAIFYLLASRSYAEDLESTKAEDSSAPEGQETPASN